MTLQKYITYLEQLIKDHGDMSLRIGLGDPHSYRGDYSQLAFAPTADVKLSTMLREAQECLGKVFEGYKGGDFPMHKETKCWIDQWGRWNEVPLNKKAMRLLLLIARMDG